MSVGPKCKLSTPEVIEKFKKRVKDINLEGGVLNYILQATETEIATTILRTAQRFLDKYKTKAVLYTYDSILFDLYKPEQEQVLKPLIEIMRMKDKFPVKVYEGETYDSVVQITL